MERQIKSRLVTVFILLAAALWSWAPTTVLEPACHAGQLCVAFLDVGQGDAIFIQSPTGTQMLIDGGRGSAVLRELGAVMSARDRTIDYIVATHPDADHVGGLHDVLERYAIEHVIRTENESDTPVWHAVEEAIREEGARVTYARRGQRIDLGAGAVAEVFFPEGDMSESESNTASIILKLTYGEHSWLLTGDAPKGIEEYLVLTEGQHLKSTALKVGHHGSRTSTSELFLDEVEPQYAVISSGKDNQYGHPHVEVTDLLFNKHIETYSTAEVGRVTFWSDGTELLVKK
ncbi:MAG: ComEC/Rec2 family competence protein [Candidatus Paceibacterota bacterium]